MDRASEELERRSRYLSSLVRRTKLADPPEPEPEPEPERERDVVPKLAAEPSAGEGKGGKVVEARGEKEVKELEEEKATKGEGNGEERKVAVRVRAADMPPALQRRAIRVALEASAAMPRIDSKRLALALKKVSSYAEHIVSSYN
ncbi:hypothetical protein E2562_002803 [Oryza meyeriana var. granulata]|uniref:Uncharacterized protein n=1 Tax=Oryza meyeriana var. granulata TaxID=110450 RepID=A0A6G1BRG0_9ORYZ|nr:hypothetical protein E2562_002803 [Oryza meyeriana var. granulata]